jgi:hypothetical protein
MIRATTIFWIVLAAITGTGLFQLKHVVQDMDEELARLNRQILAEHQHIHVLRAEWSRHNQPQRLQQFAQRHLDLEPMKPAQIARLSDLPRRAPAETQANAATPSPASAPQRPGATGGQVGRIVASRPDATRSAPPAPVPAPIAARPVADAGAALQRGGPR